MTPSLRERVITFDPIHITEEDLEDLATFTGLSPDQCLDRVRQYSLNEMAEAWRRRCPETPQEVLDFYRETDLYVWELMQWHASTARYPYWDTLNYFAKHFPPDAGWRSVYDFGCGIGSDGLFLASHGYDVTLVDVDGPAFRFARHRFERRGLRANFANSHSPLPEPQGTYDAVVAFDVLEHLPDPLNATRRLGRALRRGGLFLQQGTFADRGEHPCHLPGGVTKFRGLRWHIHLAALGFRGVTGMLYRKLGPMERITQMARYLFWRVSGLWLVRVEP